MVAGRPPRARWWPFHCESSQCGACSVRVRAPRLLRPWCLAHRHSTYIRAGDWFKKKLMDFPNVLSLTGKTDWKRGWRTDRETAAWLWRRDMRDMWTCGEGVKVGVCFWYGGGLDLWSEKIQPGSTGELWRWLLRRCSISWSVSVKVH